MRINGIVSKELLASPDLFDNEGKPWLPCFIVPKQGATTDPTAGCYTGLESFLCDENGVGSMEIAIYNFDKRSGPFSDHLGRMVAIIHSGKSKSGGLTSTRVTYRTPAHWLIPRIMKKYPSLIRINPTHCYTVLAAKWTLSLTCFKPRMIT
jgi:hypothetical protein